MQYRCGKCRETKGEVEFTPSQRKTGAYCRACMREINRKKFGPHPSRPCEHCGAIMEDPNPKARFCGVKCKNDAKNARVHARFLAASAERTCQACGTSLVGRRTDARWCSEKCGNSHPDRAVIRAKTKRRYNLKAKYSLTETEYGALLRKQQDRCAICGSTDPKDARYGKWAIDHDHVTGQVRGLLCSRCNTGIGQLRDDPEIITAAAKYIRRHRQMVLQI